MQKRRFIFIALLFTSGLGCGAFAQTATMVASGSSSQYATPQFTTQIQQVGMIDCDEASSLSLPPLPPADNSEVDADDDSASNDSEGSAECDNSEPTDDSEADESAVAATLLPARLHQFGPISASMIYTGGVFNNTRGGLDTNGATRYRSNLDIVLSLDTAAANWWDGGEFSVYFQQTDGHTLTQDFVADGQFYDGFDTGANQAISQLGEYWYRHSFDDGNLNVTVGRQDANAIFAYPDLGGDFVNSSFLTLANVPLPTWPYQTGGVAIQYQANDKWLVSAGGYDHGRDVGQWWTTTTNRGAFFIGQLDYQPWAGESDLTTVIRAGSWLQTSDCLSTDGSRVFDDNYGFYLTGDQMLFTEAADATQGFGIFGMVSYAPGDRNAVDFHYGGGAVYRGLLPDRDQDTVGVGFTLIQFSDDVASLTGQTNENAIECYYKAFVRDWLTVEPDLQYIARPNGIERDALVVGLRFDITF